MTLDRSGIVITGASQGLGKAIAAACLRAGASVLITGRHADGLNEAAAELSALAMADRQVLSFVADASIPEQAQATVEKAIADLPHFLGLVNNAGVWGPMGRLEDVPWDEWVAAIHTNLIGPALMCRFALPHLRARRYGKIVNLSGGGATAPMPRISAYAASKSAVVRLTETLAQEAHDDGIRVNALAPGALNTRMLDQLLQAGPDRVGSYFQRGLKQKEEGGASLERAAALAVYLLSPASDAITGRLLSAVWDPWPTLDERAAELAATDVYTLRRIVPKDRGFDWE